jgi:hypothetical protein
MKARATVASPSTPGQLPPATAALIEHTSGPPPGRPAGAPSRGRFEEVSVAEVIAGLASVSGKTDGLIRHFVAMGDRTPRGREQPAIRKEPAICDWSF